MRTRENSGSHAGLAWTPFCGRVAVLILTCCCIPLPSRTLARFGGSTHRAACSPRSRHNRPPVAVVLAANAARRAMDRSAAAILERNATAAARKHPRGLRLFLDLDGVLADFDAAATSILGSHPDTVEPRLMWSALARHGSFFASLSPMSDAQQLWEFAQPYSPTILTGSPHGALRDSWQLRSVAITAISLLAPGHHTRSHSPLRQATGRSHRSGYGCAVTSATTCPSSCV